MQIVESILFDELLPESVTLDIQVISNVTLITQSLFEELKKRKLISGNTSYKSIIELYSKKNAQFVLNKNVSIILKNLIKEKTFNENELLIFLFNYYLKELDNLKGDILLFKLYYEEIVEILLIISSNKINEAFINATEFLLYNEEYIFLSPLIQSLYNNISDEDKFNNDNNKFITAIILLCLSIIYKDKDDYRSSLDTVESSIAWFDRINKEKLEDRFIELLKFWHGSALQQKSELLFLNNQFFASMEAIYKAKTISNNNTSIDRELSYTYLYMGLYLHAEIGLVNLYKWFTSNNRDKTTDELVGLVATLFDINAYYQELGFYTDAQEILNVLHNEIKNYEKDDLWYLLYHREQLILSLKISLIEENYKFSKKIVPDILNNISTLNKIGKEKYNIKSLYWLSKTELLLNNFKAAEKYLHYSLALLIKNNKASSKEYIEHSLLYADIIFNKGELSTYKKILLRTYTSAKELLGSHHLILKIIIGKLNDLNLEDNTLFLKEHDESITYVLNTDIRVSGFSMVSIKNSEAIINEIRNKHIALLTCVKDSINFTGYSLPFYKNYVLLKIEIKSLSANLINYFLYKDLENIYRLDLSNSSIYHVSDQDLSIDSIEKAMLYIRFFFDSVEGKYGKFYFIENAVAISAWNYSVGNLEWDKFKELLGSEVKKITFLFEDIVDDKTIFWHFSVNVLFKGALFRSKTELNIKNGRIRLYDDTLLKEDLPITIDIRSTVFDN